MKTNISFVIASYNKRKQIEQVVKSILCRSIPGDQLVVIDDGSTDGTKEYLDKLNLSIKYDVLFQEDKGYRLATARNNGIKLAINDCIIQLDDDYLLTGNIIEKARSLYRKDRLIIFQRDEMDEGKNIIRDKRLSPRWQKEKAGKNLLRFTLTGSPPAIFAGWGMLMYNKEMMQEIGMYDERMNGKWGGEDCLTITKAYYYGIDVLYYVGERCVHLEHEKRPNRFMEREDNERKMKDLLLESLHKDKFSI